MVDAVVRLLLWIVLLLLVLVLAPACRREPAPAASNPQEIRHVVSQKPNGAGCTATLDNGFEIETNMSCEDMPACVVLIYKGTQLDHIDWCKEER